MRNAIDIMRRRGAGVPASDFIDMLDRQVSKMTRIVDDLLEAARIARPHIDLRKMPVVLQDVLRNAVETVRATATQHRLDLDIKLPAEPLVLDGDATRLEQVFCNLLENSVKFTPDGGKIALLLSVEPHDHGTQRQAVVRVRDEGIGISSELLPHVFDLFVQADKSLDHSAGGLGIGLSLVRGLVERHGGTVSAHSEGTGRGSEFVVRLPMVDGRSTSQPRRAEQPLARKSSAVERVLVVDDNQDFLASMAALLGEAGMTVKTARNGEEALKLATEFRPTSVLLDLGMPGMDGYEVARRLRRNAQLRQPVLIATTGYGDVGTVSRVREAGFDHHLTKPMAGDAVLVLLGRSGKGVPE
jgi:CheY-like chemotaxis protein